MIASLREYTALFRGHLGFAVLVIAVGITPWVARSITSRSPVKLQYNSNLRILPDEGLVRSVVMVENTTHRKIGVVGYVASCRCATLETQIPVAIEPGETVELSFVVRRVLNPMANRELTTRLFLTEESDVECNWNVIQEHPSMSIGEYR